MYTLCDPFTLLLTYSHGNYKHYKHTAHIIQDPILNDRIINVIFLMNSRDFQKKNRDLYIK